MKDKLKEIHEHAQAIDCLVTEMIVDADISELIALIIELEIHGKAMQRAGKLAVDKSHTFTTQDVIDWEKKKREGR